MLVRSKEVLSIRLLKSRKVKLIGIVIVVVVIAAWAINYFSTDVVKIHGNEYKPTKIDDSRTVLTSFTAPDINIIHSKKTVKVELYNQTYDIVPNQDKTSYEVTYPSGKNYTIKAVPPNQELLAYDELGQPYEGETVITVADDTASHHTFTFYPALLVKVFIPFVPSPRCC